MDSTRIMANGLQYQDRLMCHQDLKYSPGWRCCTPEQLRRGLTAPELLGTTRWIHWYPASTSELEGTKGCEHKYQALYENINCSLTRTIGALPASQNWRVPKGEID